MAKALDQTEIARRLQQLRNLTKLHAAARVRINQLKTRLADLAEQLAAKDVRIAELEVQLLDKEAQRKALAAKLFKARKPKPLGPGGTDTTADQAKPGASGTPDVSVPLSKRHPGAQPGHRGSRRPAPPEADVTDRQTFDTSVCPACKHVVGEVVDTVEKYQEDIDLAPRNKIVRHYTITRRWCSNCQEYVRPVGTPAQHLRRFGPNVMGYILYARYRLRLPLLKIQESLSDLHGFAMSEGEIQNQLDDAKAAFGDQYDLICELIRTAKVVYADESSWRMDGENWYIWAFVSPEDGAIRYEVADTRGGGIAQAALVDEAKAKTGYYEDRVVISDGYAVYGSLPGENQQCWVHLLRVAKAKTKQLYGELCVVYAALLLELSKPLADRTPESKQKLQDQLAAIRDHDYNRTKRGQPMKEPPEPLAPEIQRRVADHFDQLLVCLDYDNVLPENNTAEQAIRPQVILRKIFGGSRSPTGAQIHAVNTSVIATTLKRNPSKSFFAAMMPLVEEAHTKPLVKVTTA